MSKGMVFVVGYSVVLLCLFATFCYLMTTVNPKKVHHDAAVNTPVTPSDNPSLLRRKGDSSIIIRRKPSKPEELSKLLNDQEESVTLSYKSPIQRVVPPIWPILSSPSTATVPSLPKMTPTLVRSSPVKGFRRSVKDDANEINVDGDTESVVLKIMDDKGQSRIEIVLGSNAYFRRRKDKSSHSDQKRKSNMSIMSNNNTKVYQYLIKNSEIKLLPDNTLIVNDYGNIHVEGDDGSNNTDSTILEAELPMTILDTVTNLTNTSTQSQSSTASEVNVIETNETFRQQHLPKPTTEINSEVYTLKVLYDNKTRLITKVDNLNGSEYFTNEDNVPKNVSDIQSTNGILVYETTTDYSDDSETTYTTYDFQSIRNYITTDITKVSTDVTRSKLGVSNPVHSNINVINSDLLEQQIFVTGMEDITTMGINVLSELSVIAPFSNIDVGKDSSQISFTVTKSGVDVNNNEMVNKNDDKTLTKLEVLGYDRNISSNLGKDANNNYINNVTDASSKINAAKDDKQYDIITGKTLMSSYNVLDFETTRDMTNSSHDVSNELHEINGHFIEDIESNNNSIAKKLDVVSINTSTFVKDGDIKKIINNDDWLI